MQLPSAHTTTGDDVFQTTSRQIRVHSNILGQRLH
jgi:hypothetical protein